LVGGNFYLVFRSIQAIISFLSIIPIARHPTQIDINYVAKAMYLFPFAGAIIGSIVGLFAYAVSLYIQPFLLGFLVTALLLIVTGANHTDALADFADGLMAKGGKEIKYKAMLDPSVGSAGTAAVVLYVVGMVVVISSFRHEAINLLTGLVVAETIAKYIMVVQAHIGSSAWEGFSSPFTASMKDKRKFLAASAIMILILVATRGGYPSIMSLVGSLLIGIIIYFTSKRSFGGISGDVLGASNELIRLSSLIIFSAATNDWAKQAI
jgi:adenosylcobinamide-GDP ribazoletransferase